MTVEVDGRGSADSHVIAYRPDIDGLRAIAVLSVVFFHLSNTLLPGGYLGVDVFFVISGFLITSIIWRELQERQFTIARFYDRRIRRIVPALLAMLFVSTITAIFILLPANLISYAKSLLATLVFMSNIFFWQDGGYFGGPAEQKPLLHLWSIGVEEQFYIFFPLILSLVLRFWPRGVIPTIVLLTIGSFALNVLAYFFDGAVPAFFLLPTRAWELGFGAILAVLPPHVAPRGRIADVLALVGGALVLFSVVYPVQILWFLPIALLAVTGATMVIIAGKAESPIINRVLRSTPLVFIGLISYSLYLWHWPIIVFSQYVLVRHLTNLEIVGALLLIGLCSVASWHFVERPFRSKRTPARTVQLIGGSGAVAMAAVAFGLVWTDGLPGRLSREAATINAAIETHFRCPVSNYISVGLARGCQMGVASRNPEDADTILMGNSHALMYTPAWSSILAERGETGLLLNVNRCLPTTAVNVDKNCFKFASRNLATVLELTNAHLVIIAFSWEPEAIVDESGAPVDNTDNKALIAALDDLIAQLQQGGKQVILVGPIATPGYNFASTVSRQIAFGRPLDRPISVPTATFMEKFATALHHFEARDDIGFVRADQVQCNKDQCNFIVDGRSLFSDGNHISANELHRFRPLFEAVLHDKLERQRVASGPGAAISSPAPAHAAEGSAEGTR